MGAMMNPEIKGYLIEEFDAQGNLVWKITTFFEPDSLQWTNELKGKKHNLVISKLGVIESKTISGVEKKYDSSKFVVGL
jgi:hypothetical protein